MSLEMVSGGKPCASAARATRQVNEPEPCPTSNRMPRSRAAKASGQTRPSSSSRPPSLPWKQCVTTSPGRMLREQLGQRHPHVDHVHHQRQARGRPAASRARRHRRSRIGADHLIARAQLDPGDHVAVRLGHAHALLDRGPADVLELADEPRDHALDGDVEIGVDARPRLLDDEPAQPRERLRARGSDVDARRRAAPQQVAVGVDAVVGHAVVDVDVEVDQPRDDEQAAGLDALAPLQPSPTAAMRPSSIATSAIASMPVAGQSTWPPATTRSCVTESGPRPAGARARARRRAR